MAKSGQLPSIGEHGADAHNEDKELLDYEESVAGGDESALGEGGARKRKRVDGQGGAVQDGPPTHKDNAPEPANAPTPRKLYWLTIMPSDPTKWTEAQKASALRITANDLASCCALPLSEMNCIDEKNPDRFAQSGVTATNDEFAIKGLSAAFETKEARAEFIRHTHGVLLVSSSDDADDPEAQVEYNVKLDDSTPEMAFALLKQQSSRVTVKLERAPFIIMPSMISKAIEESFEGCTLVHKARRSTELDDEGRPLTSVIGGKAQMHARIAKGGGKVSLPRVLVINKWPLRYKIQKGFLENHCNGCHQHPCECKEVQAELERTLAFKADMRGKQKARSQANRQQAEAASSGAAPPKHDARSALLAKRGAKGQAVMNKRTEKQKNTACKHWTATGTCPFGDRCSFKHGTPECKAHSCIYTYCNRVNVLKANEPTTSKRLTINSTAL